MQRIDMRCINRSTLYFMNDIRMLWEEHSTWTGMAVTSIVFKLPNEDVVVNRLLQNPVDFAIALKPFYDEKTSSIFATLLTEHLMLAGELIKAIMAGDSKKAETIRKKWYENADEISEFLSYINRYWSEKAWKDMFHEHLGFVENMAVYMIKGNYEASVLSHDELEKGVLEMADMMSAGIIKQFPRKFRS